MSKEERFPRAAITVTFKGGRESRAIAKTVMVLAGVLTWVCALVAVCLFTGMAGPATFAFLWLAVRYCRYDAGPWLPETSSEDISKADLALAEKLLSACFVGDLFFEWVLRGALPENRPPTVVAAIIGAIMGLAGFLLWKASVAAISALHSLHRRQFEADGVPHDAAN